MAKRVIWIVLDSAGIGEEPDADKFGDVGSDTFGHILETYPDAKFDNLTKLGLRAIENTSFYDAATKQDVIGVYGKARQGYDNRTLGDDWDSYKTCIPDVSKWIPTGDYRCIYRADRLWSHLRKQGRIRHSDHCRIWRGTHEDRISDRLYVGRFGIPDRGVRGEGRTSKIV